jgi:epoxyqueuosine reductase QueG
MEKSIFEHAMREYIHNDPGNVVSKEVALRPELAGMRIYDEPVIGYAAASDPLFSELTKPEVIGDHHLMPGAWLAGAQTVISAFLPFTETPRKANSADMNWPADEWLHARIEGQECIQALFQYAAEMLVKEGFAAVVPITDPRFKMWHPYIKDRSQQGFYSSNWSERHVAYICGIGTFGLSTGLITEKGTAGRCISLVTNAFFEPSPRTYTKIDEYCIHCGACIRNCPANAISEKRKEHPPCSVFLDQVKEKHSPRYGCGKCQVQVPCENRNPTRR